MVWESYGIHQNLLIEVNTNWHQMTSNEFKCDFLKKDKKDGCTLDWIFRPFRRRREMLQWPTLWFPHSPFALWGGEQWIKFWTMGNWVVVSNNFLKISPLIGVMIQFEKYLSNGLKPPTRKSLLWFPVSGSRFPEDLWQWKWGRRDFMPFPFVWFCFWLYFRPDS